MKYWKLKKEDMTSLESYIKEYYQQILKRLREMEADLNIEEKKGLCQKIIGNYRERTMKAVVCTKLGEPKLLE